MSTYQHTRLHDVDGMQCGAWCRLPDGDDPSGGKISILQINSHTEFTSLKSITKKSLTRYS